MKHDEYFKLMGKILGYPECCVNHFTIMWINMNRGIFRRVSHNPLNGTGFVPCNNCRHDLPKLLHHIAKNRHKDLPAFPISPPRAKINEILGFDAAKEIEKD